MRRPPGRGRRGAGRGGGTRWSAAAGSTGRGPSRSRARWVNARRCRSPPRRCRRTVGRSMSRPRMPRPGRVAARRGDPYAEPDREVEALRVGLEVVGQVVLARERRRLAREGHPRQAVVLGGGVEAQAVPLLPPAVPDALVAVEDDAVAALLLQVVRRRQAGLAGADDDGLDVFHGSSSWLGEVTVGTRTGSLASGWMRILRGGEVGGNTHASRGQGPRARRRDAAPANDARAPVPATASQKASTPEPNSPIG